MIVAAQMIGIGEALVFARQAGADLDAVVDAVSGSAARCWTLDNPVRDMVEGVFDPGFFATYQYKDLRIDGRRRDVRHADDPDGPRARTL